MHQSLDHVRRPGAIVAATGSGAFDPRQAAEIAAGYFWDPTAATGSGATFTLPEGNGKSTHNLVTPAANTAPTTGTINSQTVVQYVNGSPDLLMRTNTTVQRGWTGATYFAAWLQAAAAPGQILGHWRTATNMLLQFNAGDCRINVNDGAGKEFRFPAATYGATPFFVEGMFDPSQAATARLRLFLDLVEQTPTVTASVGTTITDTSEYIHCGGVTNDSTTLNYVADYKTGVIYLASGIPSAAVRAQIYQYRALK